jgi:hypothetical protein
MTPIGKRVQTVNPPGSEVGLGTVATWGTVVTDEVNVCSRISLRMEKEWKIQQTYCIQLDRSIDVVNDNT